MKESKKIYVGFKGTGNSSNKIVQSLEGDKCFLTNSVNGIKKDIEALKGGYDKVYMFGLDKMLKKEIRVEQLATNKGASISSELDISKIVKDLNTMGIKASKGISGRESLCNIAYWYMLNKYCGNVAFFHIPSIKYINEDFISKIKEFFEINDIEKIDKLLEDY